MSGATLKMFTIDTLQFSEKLIDKGMAPPLAKVLVEELKEIGEQSIDGLATKQDLREVKQELKQEIADVRKDMQISEQRLLIRLGSLIILTGFAVAAFLAWHLEKIIAGHFLN